jgi:hypothetical protein
VFFVFLAAPFNVLRFLLFRLFASVDEESFWKVLYVLSPTGKTRELTPAQLVCVLGYMYVCMHACFCYNFWWGIVLFECFQNFLGGESTVSPNECRIHWQGRRRCFIYSQPCQQQQCQQQQQQQQTKQGRSSSRRRRRRRWSERSRHGVCHTVGGGAGVSSVPAHTAPVLLVAVAIAMMRCINFGGRTGLVAHRGYFVVLSV